MWSGSLADSTVITEDIMKMADTYFRSQNIVIGHLNHPPVSHVFDRLADIVRDRNLRAVTSTTCLSGPAGSHSPHRDMAGLLPKQLARNIFRTVLFCVAPGVR
jgi:hypothetical protein